MKKVTKESSARKRLEQQIISSKGHTPEHATQMAERLKKLIEFMRCGHALIAYYKQDGTFCLVEGTLMGYEFCFKQPVNKMIYAPLIVYKDVELQSWRTFRAENFMEWKPIM